MSAGNTILLVIVAVCTLCLLTGLSLPMMVLDPATNTLFHVGAYIVRLLRIDVVVIFVTECIARLAGENPAEADVYASGAVAHTSTSSWWSKAAHVATAACSLESVAESLFSVFGQFFGYGEDVSPSAYSFSSFSTTPTGQRKEQTKGCSDETQHTILESQKKIKKENTIINHSSEQNSITLFRDSLLFSDSPDSTEVVTRVNMQEWITSEISLCRKSAEHSPHEEPQVREGGEEEEEKNASSPSAHDHQLNSKKELREIVHFEVNEEVSSSVRSRRRNPLFSSHSGSPLSAFGTEESTNDELNAFLNFGGNGAVLTVFANAFRTGSQVRFAHLLDLFVDSSVFVVNLCAVAARFVFDTCVEPVICSVTAVCQWVYSHTFAPVFGGDLMDREEHDDDDNGANDEDAHSNRDVVRREWAAAERAKRLYRFLTTSESLRITTQERASAGVPHPPSKSKLSSTRSSSMNTTPSIGCTSSSSAHRCTTTNLTNSSSLLLLPSLRAIPRYELVSPFETRIEWEGLDTMLHGGKLIRTSFHHHRSAAAADAAINFDHTLISEKSKSEPTIVKTEGEERKMKKEAAESLAQNKNARRTAGGHPDDDARDTPRVVLLGSIETSPPLPSEMMNTVDAFHRVERSTARRSATHHPIFSASIGRIFVRPFKPSQVLYEHVAHLSAAASAKKRTKTSGTKSDESDRTLDLTKVQREREGTEEKQKRLGEEEAKEAASTHHQGSSRSVSRRATVVDATIAPRRVHSQSTDSMRSKNGEDNNNSDTTISGHQDLTFTRFIEKESVQYLLPILSEEAAVASSELLRRDNRDGTKREGDEKSTANNDRHGGALGTQESDRKTGSQRRSHSSCGSEGNDDGDNCEHRGNVAGSRRVNEEEIGGYAKSERGGEDEEGSDEMDWRTRMRLRHEAKIKAHERVKNWQERHKKPNTQKRKKKSGDKSKKSSNTLTKGGGLNKGGYGDLLVEPIKSNPFTDVTAILTVVNNNSNVPEGPAHSSPTTHSSPTAAAFSFVLGDRSVPYCFDDGLLSMLLHVPSDKDSIATRSNLTKTESDRGLGSGIDTVASPSATPSSALSVLSSLFASLFSPRGEGGDRDRVRGEIGVGGGGGGGPHWGGVRHFAAMHYVCPAALAFGRRGLWNLRIPPFAAVEVIIENITLFSSTPP